MNVNFLRSKKFWEDAKPFAADGSDLSGVSGIGGCVAFRTSGSSGKAKWIVLEKRALLLSARAVNDWLEVDGDSRWGLALPLHHVGGFGVVARTYVAGCGLEVFLEKWDAGKFSEWAEQVGLTHVSLVPTQIYDLVKAGCIAPVGLKAIVVGGGRLAAGLGQQARNLDWPVLESYGMTEACSQIGTQELASISARFDAKPIKVLPIWSVRNSEDGLLELSGPALFYGILQENPDALVFQKRTGEWFVTNDRVAIEGRALFPLGRADRLVKVMGELIDLDVLEKRLSEVCGGEFPEGSFAIVAVADERKEHILFGVFEESLQSVAECFERYQMVTSGVERLAGILRISEIPRGDLGKIRRQALADWCAREVMS